MSGIYNGYFVSDWEPPEQEDECNLDNLDFDDLPGEQEPVDDEIGIAEVRNDN